MLEQKIASYIHKIAKRKLLTQGITKYNLNSAIESESRTRKKAMKERTLYHKRFDLPFLELFIFHARTPPRPRT